MPTDLVSRVEQYRRIADNLRLLADGLKPNHQSRLLTIADNLERLADTVEDDPAQ